MEYGKEKTINIRVDEEIKQTIEAAAAERGQSITSFVVEAAMREARRKRPKQTATPPRFFRTIVAEGQRGGSRGYEEAGFHLAIHAHEYLSYDYEDGEEIAAMEKLESSVAKGDDKAVLSWFEEEFPKLMELIPTRRHDQFLKGVYGAWEEGRIGG